MNSAAFDVDLHEFFLRTSKVSIFFVTGSLMNKAKLLFHLLLCLELSVGASYKINLLS